MEVSGTEVRGDETDFMFGASFRCDLRGRRPPRPVDLSEGSARLQPE